jgi:ABC-2 type transport system ATP-binding protein
MNIIEIRNLSHRYWTKASWPYIDSATSWTTEAVRDVTLFIPNGSVTAMLGANGAGKTTLLKVLVNLLRPSAGTAQVFGVDSTRLGERELAQIGYVSENQQRPGGMTVRQRLDYCRPFYPTWDRTLEAALLARFDLPMERKLSELSRGMLVKAMLLSSLAYRPRLLVLDEPFSGLDPVARDDVTQGLLESVRQGETTVLVSSHDIEEVERIADRVTLLESGCSKFTETTESLLGRFRRVEVAQEGAWQPGSLPASWIAWESGAGRISFVESAFDHEITESHCRKHFPFGSVQVRPMTLREIFLTQARKDRTQPKGAAA